MKPMRACRHTLAFSAISLVMLTSSAAYAVTATTQPGASRPEFVDRPYRLETTRPDVGGAPVVSDSEEATGGIKSDLAFTLKSIRFDGLKQYNESDIKHLYAGKIGQRITVTQLNGIVSDITAFYRNNGYILTRAVLPPQRIASGEVTIRIVEGFVNTVSVVGDVGNSNSVLHRFAEKIKHSKPLNSRDLERYLLLMEDLPGVEARAVLKPAANTPGASDVVVNITRKKMDAAVAVDNRGSRFLGQEQASATIAGNNLFGREEQTQLRVLNSFREPTELQYFELRHEHQLGNEGTKAALIGNYARTRPGSSLDLLQLDGWSSAVTAGVSHPYIRSRRTNWFANGDFTVRDADVQILGVNLYRDKLRVLKVGTSYDFMDPTFAINRVEGNVSKGFNWWTDAGNRTQSRSNGEESFLKINGKATRIQPIYGPWSGFASATGQYAADALLAAEEFALGGQEFGSAYDSAELTGDHGLAGRLELQYNGYGGTSGADLVTDYQLYGFYDIGRVWNRNLVSGESRHASLASAGIGTRFNMSENTSGGLEFAVPLTRSVNANGQDGDAPRVFFNLQYRY
jgi:hemolysin activation/secretion protein